MLGVAGRAEIEIIVVVLVMPAVGAVHVAKVTVEEVATANQAYAKTEAAHIICQPVLANS